MNKLRLREATIRASHQIFASDQARKAHDPVGDKPRMLDRHRVMCDYARNQDFALWQFRRFPDTPLMLVAWIGRLYQIRSGAHAQDEAENFFERRVREIQERVGYTGDYDSWIAKVTPPDLE